MNQPKVSVIIPVHNGEKEISSCLSSVLKQSYLNYEVIVVDNCSTDRTKQIIETFKKTSGKIIYLFEPTLGRGAARCTGEKRVTGEIILMTDVDCTVPENWIHNMCAPILRGECDGVQGFEESLNNDFVGNMTQRQLETKYRNIQLLSGKDLIGYLDTKNFAIRRKNLEEIGFSPVKYQSNDTALAILLSKTSAQIKFEKNIKVAHKNPGSIPSLAKKQFDRAFDVYQVTKDYEIYLKNSSFLYETNQTSVSFFIFFHSLIKSILREHFAETFFKMIQGTAWRAGLLWGTIRN